MFPRGTWLKARCVRRGLRDEDLGPDPVAAFQRWFAEAGEAGICMPEAVTLATVGADHRPTARMMLLKGVDARGFRFFTNDGSRKGRALAANPFAALAFHWKELHRQVRIEGRVEKISTEETRAYFVSRPKGSQLGAWASEQSAPLSSREDLMSAFKDYEKRFEGGDIPVPPFWCGFMLAPDRIEFWQGRPNRLHDRLCYTRAGDNWSRVRLAP